MKSCPGCCDWWLRKTRAVVLSGLRSAEVLENTAFITVTAPGRAGGLVDLASIAAWNAGAAERWNHLRTRIRQFYPRAEFFRVGEVQERGAIHYHILVRDVPFLTEERLRSFAVAAGFGPVCDVRPLRHVGGAAAYLSKYLTKDVSSWPSHLRLWSCSAHWRVEWYPSYLRRDGQLKGSRMVTVLGTGEVYYSLSPYEFDSEEAERMRRRRREAAQRGGRNVQLSTSSRVTFSGAHEVQRGGFIRPDRSGFAPPENVTRTELTAGTSFTP